MRIPPEMFAEVVEHCRTEAIGGIEACGVLAGPHTSLGEVTERHPMLNMHEQPRYRWQFDPERQVELWHDLDARDMRPRVIYHSHVFGEAVMSDDDVRYAMDPTIGHLILSIPFREARLWVVIKGRVIAGDLQVAGQRGPSVHLDRWLDKPGALD